MTALGTLERHLEQAVAESNDSGRTVGRDPQVALVVERNVVGAGDRRHHLLRESGEVGGGVDCGVAADQQQVPREGDGCRVVSVFGELDDVAIAVGVTRVHLGRALFADLAAVGVVGARHVHLAGLEARLDVFATIHLRGTHRVGSETSEDQGLFGREAGDLADAVDDERNPLAGSVELSVSGQGAEPVDLGNGGVAREFRDIQAPAGQKSLVHALGFRRRTLSEFIERDVLVEVVEALVVTHVCGDVTGLADDHVRPLVLEAAHRGVLHRGLFGCGRVDLDDPSEAVGFVLVAGGASVEARVDSLPEPPSLFVAEAIAKVGCAGTRRAEVAVEVFLARKHRAPRRGAPSAVAQGAEHDLAGAVGDRLEEGGAGGGPGHDERGRSSDASIAAAAELVGPGSTGPPASEFDDRHAVRHHRGAALGVGFLGCGRGREHDVLVRVLVVRDEVALARGGVEDVEVVVVVAELASLGIRSLIVRVECVRLREERVAPADDRRPLVALRNHELVGGCRNRSDRGESETRLRGGCRRATVDRRADDDRSRARSRTREQRSTRESRPDDVAEVAVVARVGHRMETGVRAFEMAGDSTALTGGVPLHGELVLQKERQ